jgi:hypothetical protein
LVLVKSAVLFWEERELYRSEREGTRDLSFIISFGLRAWNSPTLSLSTLNNGNKWERDRVFSMAPVVLTENPWN